LRTQTIRNAQCAAFRPVGALFRPHANEGIVHAIACVAGGAEHVPGRRLKRRVEFAVVVHPICNDRSLTAAWMPVNDTLR
jgi:hypothetical protein